MILHTESGSVYELDLDNDTFLRRPDPEAENALRRDEEPIPILRIPYPPVVGKSFQIFLDLRGDGVWTVRTTTPLVKIEVAK